MNESDCKSDEREQETLSPCPFCGSAVHLVRKGMGIGTDRYWWIECKCGGALAGYMQRVNAIAAWNRRASTPRAADEPPPSADDEAAFEQWWKENVTLITTTDTLRGTVKWVWLAATARQRERITELTKLNQGYYGEASKGWLEFRQAERENAQLREQIAAANNLLAVLHRDGGHHTDSVGFVQSCLDAEEVRHRLMDNIDQLRDALQFYADPSNWNCRSLHCDEPNHQHNADWWQGDEPGYERAQITLNTLTGESNNGR